MATQPVYYFVYKQSKCLDFQTILYIFSEDSQESRDSNRSTLWRYLKRKRYKSYQIKNFRIFHLNDILSDSYLISRMSNIVALAQALEEE